MSLRGRNGRGGRGGREPLRVVQYSREPRKREAYDNRQYDAKRRFIGQSVSQTISQGENAVATLWVCQKRTNEIFLFNENPDNGFPAFIKADKDTTIYASSIVSEPCCDRNALHKINIGDYVAVSRDSSWEPNVFFDINKNAVVHTSHRASVIYLADRQEQITIPAIVLETKVKELQEGHRATTLKVTDTFNTKMITMCHVASIHESLAGRRTPPGTFVNLTYAKLPAKCALHANPVSAQLVFPPGFQADSLQRYNILCPVEITPRPFHMPVLVSAMDIEAQPWFEQLPANSTQLTTISKDFSLVAAALVLFDTVREENTANAAQTSSKPTWIDPEDEGTFITADFIISWKEADGAQSKANSEKYHPEQPRFNPMSMRPSQASHARSSSIVGYSLAKRQPANHFRAISASTP
ncbi:hypothetical protein QR680_014697 [Steinernema hermaphroditum]|uniref:Uncharacterized protein n=1 Tax=Steinernema hermaphroditum TaxID=289476 RepID=A0AA39IC25_9BILA|nr:hypothetical protein QR680_014697 [Steinernema hermaphroditum]